MELWNWKFWALAFRSVESYSRLSVAPFCPVPIQKRLRRDSNPWTGQRRVWTAGWCGGQGWKVSARKETRVCAAECWAGPSLPGVWDCVPPLGCRVTAAQALPEPRALRSRRRRPPATSSGCCGGSPPPTRASPTRARTPEAAPSRGSSGSSAAGRTRSSTESGAEEAPALPSRAAVLTTMTLTLSKQESHYRRLYRTAHPALWDHVVRVTWWRPHVTWSAASKRNLGLLLLSSWDVCLFRDKMLRRPTSVVQKRWVLISGPRAILLPTRWEEGQEGGQRTTSLLLSDFAENANGVWQTQSLSDLNMWYSCWPTWFQFTVWIRLKFLLQVRFKATFYRQKNREGRNPQLLWLPTSQTPLCELFLPRQ